VWLFFWPTGGAVAAISFYLHTAAAAAESHLKHAKRSKETVKKQWQIYAKLSLGSLEITACFSLCVKSIITRCENVLAIMKR